jgi:ADP-L-glycero-D-manno-heptose 6-epimerase
MPSRERFIVTGGSGFVGSNLVAALLGSRPGAEVVIIDDFSSSNFANIISACDRAGVPPFHGECIGRCYTTVDWNVLLSKPTRAVFHLAAITDTTVMDQTRMLAINTEGFQPLVDACLKHTVPLAYCSSAATYGTPPQTAARRPFPLSAAGRPSNIYGFSKWLMESVASRAIARAGSSALSSVVGLRYFNVFGPGEAAKGKMASMARQLVRQFAAGQTPRLFKDGSQARDQVYVEDVVNCTLAAAGLANPGGHLAVPTSGVYNVGSGVATSFREIAEAIAETPACAQFQVEYFDMPAHIRSFYQDFTCADLSETEAGLGWRPVWKPREAIARYAALLMQDATL